jgi:hypothetical protein
VVSTIFLMEVLFYSSPLYLFEIVEAVKMHSSL